MTRQFKAIKPIPGQNDPHLERVASQAAALRMLQEAMQSLSFADVLDEVEAAIEARPDVDAQLLEGFANRIGRRAHMEARNG